MGKRVKGSRRTPKVEFDTILKALLDLENPFPPKYLHHLSDLSPEKSEQLAAIWPEIPVSRRLALLEDLEELQDADTRLWFEWIARLALKDEEPDARARGISMLWEAADEDLIPTYMDLGLHDPSVEVRAAATWGLGYFIYMGELEEMDAELKPIEDHLLAIASGSDEGLVRRRAVESLGFSSRSEVPALIESAFDSDDPDWISSALFAMGRSYDTARYENHVRRMLNHAKYNVQLEAVRAAGELSLDSARRGLFDLLEQEALDPDIRDAAIWSLSQIGGEQVDETLDALLEKAEDDEDEEFILNAIDNLSLTEQVTSQLEMFDFELDNEDELGQVIDLEDESSTADDKEDEDRDDEGA
jgi:HEAT repeat protein